MRSNARVFAGRLFVFLLTAARCAAAEDLSGVAVPASTVEAPGQAIETDRTGALVGPPGQQRLIPPAADTFLWKEGREAQGGGRGLLLRDNRFSQVLVRLDLGPLPANTTLDGATFHFQITGVEKAGQPAKFECRRMLVDWSEQATWFKPSAEAATWNGLQAGVHFEAQPFASVDVPAVKKGMTIDMPGFDHALAAWRSRQWPNHGFLLTLSGKALQVTIPSRKAAPAGGLKDLKLGGAAGNEARIGFDPALVSQVLPHVEALTAAALRVRLLDRKRPAGANLVAFSADHRPLAEVPLASASNEGWIELPGLARIVTRGGPVSVILAVTGSPQPLRWAALANDRDAPRLVLQLRRRQPAELFQNSLRPMAEEYVTVRDGQLVYRGQRLRLWGAVGQGGADRVARMGFNAWRMWGPKPEKFYTPQSLRRGDFAPASRGDGSALDELDRLYADCKRHGLFVMSTQLVGFPMPIAGLAEDGSFVSGGDDWAAWKAAICGKQADPQRLVFIDERLQQAKRKHAENFLQHVNPYTGRRYAEEECIAIYELNNENGFVPQMLEGKFRTWPAYFRDKLQRRWNAWLATRYPQPAALQTAWGRLEPDEKSGTVKLAPIITERETYPEARGRDFVRFAIELVESWCGTLREHARRQAAGKGVAVVPFSFDTQYRGNLPWQYSVTHTADVATFGMYFWNLDSALARPPSLYVLDSHTVAGKPTVIYETNIGRPCAYRAEYPLRLAAFASWQDWDAIFFHYWAGLPEGTPDEQYLLLPLAPPLTSHYWTAVQHQSDPVMCASMALAGRMFLAGAVPPAPSPAVGEAGAQAIFGYDFPNGLPLGRWAFARGSRLQFAPERPGRFTVDGREPPAEATAATPLEQAVSSGEAILWDWPHARLIVDAPTFHAYVGRNPGTYRFRDGIALSNVSTPWVCWALASADGRPLATAGRMHLAAVADAGNTGFAIDLARDLAGPMNQAKAILNRGHLPVMQDAVAFSMHFPQRVDGVFHSYDFALRPASQIPLSHAAMLRYEAGPLFVGTLEIAARGSTVETPATTPVPAAAAVVSLPADHRFAPLPDVWNPIRGLAWGASSGAVLAAVRTAGATFSAARPGTDAAGKQTLLLTDANVLWSAPADVQCTFDAQGLARIDATFKQPPSLARAVAEYERQFGAPHTRVLTSQEQVSTIAWRVQQSGATLEITLTETQGTLRAVWEVVRR